MLMILFARRVGRRLFLWHFFRLLLLLLLLELLVDFSSIWDWLCLQLTLLLMNCSACAFTHEGRFASDSFADRVWFDPASTEAHRRILLQETKRRLFAVAISLLWGHWSHLRIQEDVYRALVPCMLLVLMVNDFIIIIIIAMAFSFSAAWCDFVVLVLVLYL